MSSPSSSDPKTPNSESKTLETETSTQSQNPPSMDASDPEKEKLVEETEQSKASGEYQGEEAEEEEEEEVGECGFCLFMKAGGCRDEFVAWEDCIKDAEEKKEDIVEKCAQITVKLKQCMEAHEDYYAPILQAEKAAEEEVQKELETEKKELEESKQREASGN